MDYLNLHVIGQEHAKKVIAVSVYNHYCRLAAVKAARTASLLSQQSSQQQSQMVIPEKSNILLIGPSGSGKTLLARTVSRLLKVPFAMGDATGLTEAGYVGEDVDSILYRLLEAADFNLERAQSGIIFLDEVDKIAKAPTLSKGGISTGGGRDVGGEGVQHALLKMLEGTTVQVADRRRAGGREYLAMETGNLLFVLSGAFVGLEGIVGRRLKQKESKRIGFSVGSARDKGDSSGNARDTTSTSTSNATIKSIQTNQSSPLSQLLSEDVINYGLIPEFVGRVPVLAVLEELDQSALTRTLTEPQNSLIRQYQHLFSLHHIDLHFTPSALQAIGGMAVRARTGARGLRGILEGLLLPMMFEMPGREDVKEIWIDGEYVRGERAEPRIILK